MWRSFPQYRQQLDRLGFIWDAWRDKQFREILESIAQYKLTGEYPHPAVEDLLISVDELDKSSKGLLKDSLDGEEIEGVEDSEEDEKYFYETVLGINNSDKSE